MCYHAALVAVYVWNESKDLELRSARGVSFLDILEAIASGGLVDVLKHPNPERYENQRIFVVRRADYVYLVPFVETAEEIFLKTIIPSRKATREYGGKK
ncbi:MAG TPA: toxin [Thermoanaerobaculia bacterium]|nr:toxin [Thermoanaerobaculia bacterium]